MWQSRLQKALAEIRLDKSPWIKMLAQGELGWNITGRRAAWEGARGGFKGGACVCRPNVTKVSKINFSERTEWPPHWPDSHTRTRGGGFEK